ncbi:5'/3'-nucleotidase SurE [Candidatus Palauibacter sp.]|uniref:5'/3'-nucleotidase SurE n=1 Tax=Candidatus Palauibacter sp. TaxID=3101350 RepID=UPI003B5177C7
MKTRGATRRALSAVVYGGALACGGGPASEAPAEAPDETSPFHILVTNDDGIDSPGIQELAAALRAVGEVTVVAPCGQQSGTSMSIRLNQEIRLRTSEAGHCVNATPAGAVLLAHRALQPESGFDLVVSGINIGANIGEVSHMSGTIGAAMMGAYLGVPAVAASLGGRPSGVEYPAAVVARFVAELRRRGPEAGIVYSINFPAGTAQETRGIAARPMGGNYFRVDYEEVTGADGERLFRPAFGPPDPIPAGSDTEAHNEGLVTITPLRFDWTDLATVGELEGWDLEVLLGDGGDGG